MSGIPNSAQVLIRTGIALGKTNQQIFSDLRSTGHSISYQQMVNYITDVNSQFNNSFNAVFNV